MKAAITRSPMTGSTYQRTGMRFAGISGHSGPELRDGGRERIMTGQAVLKAATGTIATTSTWSSGIVSSRRPRSGISGGAGKWMMSPCSGPKAVTEGWRSILTRSGQTGLRSRWGSTRGAATVRSPRAFRLRWSGTMRATSSRSRTMCSGRAGGKR